MSQTFRQSIAALHTWAGLLVGWVLFFVFLTGTFGYVRAEVDQWMRPEQRAVSAFPPAAHLLRLAERRLDATAPADAELWFINLPGGRGNAEFRVGWRARSKGDEGVGAFGSETLDPRTGLPITGRVRETGGGETLFAMHYQLHYIPYEAAIRIVGVCAMFMLVAILTGIVAHKKIFRDFFTFRPGKGQRSWLDGHNLLAVAALPFHLMITWSGLIFFLFAYMPLGVAALYPNHQARDRAFAQAYGFARSDHEGAGRSGAPLVALMPLLNEAEADWGPRKVSSVIVENPGRDDALVTLQSIETGLERRGLSLRFNGATGQLLNDARQTAPGKFSAVMLGLHEGRFAAPALRLLYVAAGLAGTAMVATGLLLWSTKRKAKLAANGKPHAGMLAVDVLNLGTIIGLPIGIAAYFWANRLLPVGMEGRAAWEVHTMFMTWGFTYIFAVWRPFERAWPELCWLAAGAYALIPIFNALSTTCGLIPSLLARDWVLAGFDLSALAASVFFAFLARNTARKAKARRTERRNQIEAPT